MQEKGEALLTGMFSCRLLCQSGTAGLDPWLLSPFLKQLLSFIHTSSVPTRPGWLKQEGFVLCINQPSLVAD